MAEVQNPDDSYEAMKQRAEALQPALSQLMDLALHVHRTFRPAAPHLRDVSKDAPVHYIASMNYYEGRPVSDTLTLRFSDNEYVSIEQYNGPTRTQPVWRIDHWHKYDETRNQRTRVHQFGEQSGATFTFDVETSLFREGLRHDDFLGYGYHDQEPHISALEDRLLSLVVPDTTEK